MTGSTKILMGSGATEETDDDFNLVTGLYHFDGTNGGTNATFLDSSSNAGTVTTSGGPAQGTFSPFSSDDGKWSNFFRLEDAIMTTSSGSSIAYNQSTFTCEAWILITKAPVSGTNIPGLVLLDGAANFGAAALSLAFGPLADYKLGIAWYNSGWITCYTTSATVTPGAWTHVAVSVSSNTIKLFINGTEITSMTGTTTLSNRSQGTQGYVSIGGTHYASSYSYEGYVSNFRLVDGTALYSGDFTPSTSPLTAVSGTDVLACTSRNFDGVNAAGSSVSMDLRNVPIVYPFSPFAPSAEYTAATHGGSGYFNGGYCNLAANSDFDILDNGTFTVEYWLYVKEYNTSSGYADHVGIFNGVSAGWLIYQNSTDIEVYMNGTDMISVARPDVNAWHHIALTRSSGTLRLFINGVQAGFSNASTGSDQSEPLRVGGDSGGGRAGLNGCISSFRLVKGTAVYTSAFTPPTAPVTAITNTEALLNFTNAQIIDSSGKFIFEVVGNAQLDTGTKKFGTASYESDGTGDRLSLVKFGTGTPGNLAPIGFTPFTFEGFIYINSHKNYNAIYSAGYGIQFYVNASGKMQCWVGGDAGWLTAGLESTATVSTSTWTHFALVRDTSADTITWFVNGTAGGQATSTTAEVAPIPSAQGHTIGSYESGTYSLDGFLDEFRVTHKARYTSNFTAPTKEYPNK